MLCDPTGRVEMLKDATPAAVVDVPRTVEPSLKFTSPVTGVTPPRTVAVNVTWSGKLVGLCGPEISVTVDGQASLWVTYAPNGVLVRPVNDIPEISQPCPPNPGSALARNRTKMFWFA